MLDKYDLIVPVGTYCIASDCLRLAGRQFESYPLDWLKFTTPDDAVRLFTTKCSDLLRPDLLQKTERLAGLHRIYVNSQKGIEFRHDFAEGLDWDVSFFKVQKKYERRIRRLYRRIAKANNILFVQADCSQVPVNERHLLSLWQSLQAFCAGKRIDLLQLRMNLRPQYHLTVKDLTPQLRLAEFDVDNLEDYSGYKKKIAAYLKNYHVSFAVRIKHFGAGILFRLRKTFLKLLAALPLSGNQKKLLKIRYKDRY